MKKSKLAKLAWVFFALALTTTTLFAQGRGRGTGMNATASSGYYPCLTQISDLSDQQQNQIQTLRSKHQQEMAALRTDRRSTLSWDEKMTIRQQMLDNVTAHRNSVKSLLNPEQQKQYDQVQAGGGRNFHGQSGNGAYGRGSQGACNSSIGFRGNRAGRNN